MQHMILLNPTHRKSHLLRRRRKTGTKSLFVQSNLKRKSSIMRKKRRTMRRRVRRNPPKMTPAMKSKISRAIKAKWRSGTYKKLRRASKRRSTSALVSYRSSSVVRPARRSSRRRHSVGSYTGGGGIKGNIRSLLSKENLQLAGGVIGTMFLCNFVTNKLTTVDNTTKKAMLPDNLRTNPFIIAAIKLGTAVLAAQLTKRFSPMASKGMIIGGAVVVANDLIAAYLTSKSTTVSAGTSAYLGAYMGPQVGRDVRSLVGAVSPTRQTFAPGLSGVYSGGSAFKSDAWSR